jgi:hypothetical protein
MAGAIAGLVGMVGRSRDWLGWSGDRGIGWGEAFGRGIMRHYDDFSPECFAPTTDRPPDRLSTFQFPPRATTSSPQALRGLRG